MGRTIWCIFYAALLFNLVQSNIVIPTSLGLAHDMGFPPFVSGFIISGPWMLQACVALGVRFFLMEPWRQPLVRRAFTCVATVHMLLAVVYALAADPSESLQSHCGVGARMWAIAVVRAGQGALDGLLPLLTVLVLKVTPKQHFQAFCVQRAALTCFGAGFGPLMSTLFGYILGFDSIRQQAARPMLVLACISAAMIPFYWLLLPTDIKSLEEAKVKADVALASDDHAALPLHVADSSGSDADNDPTADGSIERKRLQQSLFLA